MSNNNVLQTSTTQKKYFFIAVGLFLFLLVLSGVARLYLSSKENNAEEQRQAFAALSFYKFDHARPLADVTLSNLQGQKKPLTQHLEGWRLVNFGYMSCPDICPINLALLSTLKQEWDENNELPSLDVLHLTFDPKRDTPELLGNYLNFINQDFYGLTGDLDNIRQVTQQFNVVFIHETPDKTGNYFITHSDSIALINPQGEYVGMFKGPYQQDNMIKVLKQLLKAS